MLKRRLPKSPSSICNLKLLSNVRIDLPISINGPINELEAISFYEKLIFINFMVIMIVRNGISFSFS